MIQSLNVYPTTARARTSCCAVVVVVVVLLQNNNNKLLFPFICLYLQSNSCELISEGERQLSDRVNYQFPLHQFFNNEMTQNFRYPHHPFYVLLLTTHAHICALFLFYFVTKIAKWYFIHSCKCHFSTHSKYNENWKSKIDPKITD